MIFYFSGTGNSYAAAMQLQFRLQGELINITDCVQKEEFHFDLEENETVGIVVPVYFGALPSIVNVFLDRMTFEKKPSYIYGILTYGGTLFGAKRKLANKLKDGGYEAAAIWDVLMPNNYAISYEPTHEDEVEPILEEAGEQIEQIIPLIQDRKAVPWKQPFTGTIATGFIYPMYDRARKTKKFYSNDQCVGCGVCAGRCPVKAIEMIDGKPRWVKEQCVLCMSCVRCNAIQYGNKMTGKYRYRHPIYQKKKKQPDCH